MPIWSWLIQIFQVLQCIISLFSLYTIHVTVVIENIAISVTWKTRLFIFARQRVPLNAVQRLISLFGDYFKHSPLSPSGVPWYTWIRNKRAQQTYVQNRTRLAKVASYETSQETSVSCTQLVVLYAPFQFGSEYNFLVYCCTISMNPLTPSEKEKIEVVTFIKTLPAQHNQSPRYSTP